MTHKPALLVDFDHFERKILDPAFEINHMPASILVDPDLLALPAFDRRFSLIVANLVHRPERVLSAIRRRAKAGTGRTCPILGVATNEQTREAAIAAGFDSCLVWPVRVAQFLEAIEALISPLHGMQDERSDHHGSSAPS